MGHRQPETHNQSVLQPTESCLSRVEPREGNPHLRKSTNLPSREPLFMRAPGRPFWNCLRSPGDHPEQGHLRQQHLWITVARSCRQWRRLSVWMLLAGSPGVATRIVSGVHTDEMEPYSDSCHHRGVRLTGTKSYAVDVRDAIEAEVVEDDRVCRQVDHGGDISLELSQFRGRDTAFEDREVDAVAVGLEIM